MRTDLVVPRGKFPLYVLTEQGEEIRNRWIFLHKSVISKMRNNSGDALYDYLRNNHEQLIWKAYGTYPEHRVIYRELERTGWFLLTFARIKGIDAYEISTVVEPEGVIFVKMEGA